jgi:FtsP/CotA-like multicopper oxidase with cupredoxin domain
MTYTFVADRYGSSFYHVHYSSQYVDGLFGPMIVHGPTSVLYDIDLGPVLLVGGSNIASEA